MTNIHGGAVLELTYPVQRFIEDNITLIEENELSLFFYSSLFSLTNQHSEELFKVFTDVLNINPEPAIKAALVEWCEDNVALGIRKKVGVSQLLKNIPKFGYDSLKFRWMFIDAVKTAYPNKTVLPDSYGIEYIVEKD